MMVMETTDVAVFRPSNKNWYVRNIQTTWWGITGDIPVPADYTGDGKADLAIFRPSDSHWHVKDSSTGTLIETTWGQTGDVPVPADYDGDGIAEYAIFRPGANAQWYIKDKGTIDWGIIGDIPVPR